MQKISDLFDVQYGHSLELNRLKKCTGPEAINFVGRAARNNGVTAKVRPLPSLCPLPAGTITVALNGQGGAGVAFLQPYPYYTGFHVMVLTPLNDMTEQELLWWATCITANRFRFGFGRQANRTLKDLVLPGSDEIPDWVSEVSVDRYEGASAPQVLVNGDLDLECSGWIYFRLDDLFEIKKGQRLTKSNMLPGAVPFIGASDSQNGVTARIGQRSIHEGGTITVTYNGSVAEAFYQPEPFWASDDVNVLYPRGGELTPAAGLFVCAVLRQEKYRFNYGRKWHVERMKETVVKLPATQDGEPDWCFMERYISGLRYSSSIA